ncbi:site-specific DNA-methyltransferase (adenine-specific) [Microbacterium sp. AG1240]|uniref:Eco57I restriction-modification methylase domain-containing protein n=1 Tax=Microbacterium sp. AG1240 TaxID=2183992 RepID=UPI000EB24789|nr:Eco57I restriction-modification methylase domain-containing protein [Microbacterium sp. AG1240]RKT36144.1 site-specific DNA-methyltransferase (adenine-specific) [Microbacterium sp. AG1240]
MSMTATSRRHIPDILDCLAQLSNDEVPTPPKFANQMLDLLPDEVWSDPNLKWLDPFVKSGVFLREVATRLLSGLAEWEPDFEKRRDHIFRNMLYGTSITEMTGLLARRSLYYSRDASGETSVVKFASPDGNVPFVPAKHAFKKERCVICGAPEDLERGDSRENHAYSFIHGAYPTEELKDMKFDVIVGNPPFQIDDGGHNASATPIYQHFVEAAIDMDPRYVLMITPSRWFAGGKGLDKYRDRMLNDRHMQNLVDYPKLYDGFPGVKIRGGVSYFLWSRDYDGPCSIQTMWDGKPVGEPVARYLNAYDVLVRRNEAVSILEKVRAKNEPTLNNRVSSAKPFGLRTFFHGAPKPDGMAEPVKLYGSQRVSWVERASIPQNDAWVDNWKVLMTRVQGTSSAVETQFLGKPIVAAPKSASTESYVVAGRFDGFAEAEWYAAYLRTRFARFLVSLRKSTQDAARGVYSFIPDLPMDRQWTDEKLYERYGLNAEEIAFIESQVREMPANGEAVEE